MTALEVIGTLAGLYVVAGLSYAVVAGFTAGLRQKTPQQDCDKSLRELIAALPMVITEVEPFDDIIDVRQLPDVRSWRESPPDRKPVAAYRRGNGR